MSFESKPQVDGNAIKSEASEQRVRHYFSMKNNFILREDKPDYGVDFVAEIIEDGGATNYRIPIQLKATKKINVVKYLEVNYISFNFKTSRLNYLSLFKPSYGLVVIFDEIKEILYYEHVEKIIGTLDKLKEKENWRNQETVNILVPLENVITKNSINDIYSLFLKRFKNHEILIADYGNVFDIPIINDNKEFDIYTKKGKIDIVEKYGITFLNERNYGLLERLFEKITLEDILKSERLIFYASIYYSEVGLTINANYLLMKVNTYKNKYSEEEWELIEIAKLRVEFQLGYKSVDEYMKELIEHYKNIKDEVNLLNLRLQILYLRFISKESLGQYILLQKEIDEIIIENDKLNIDQNYKNLIRVNISQILFQIALKRLINIKLLISIKEKSNFEFGEEEKVTYFKSVDLIINKSYEILWIVLKYAKENDKKVLFFNCIYVMAVNFFMLQFNIILYSEKPMEDIVIKEEYKRHMVFLVEAYTAFHSEGDNIHAYNSLYFCTELYKLYWWKFNEDPNVINFEKISVELDEIGSVVDKTNSESMVDEIIKGKKIYECNSLKEIVLNMTKEELINYSKQILELYNLPKDRLKNIELDLTNYWMFYNKFKDENIELLQDLGHMESLETYYLNSPQYTIECSKCGLRTKNSNDIDALIKEFYDIHDNCSR